MKFLLNSLLIVVLIGCKTEPIVENSNSLTDVDFSIDSLNRQLANE